MWLKLYSLIFHSNNRWEMVEPPDPQGPKREESASSLKSNTLNVKIQTPRRKGDGFSWFFQAPFFRPFLLVLVWVSHGFQHGFPTPWTIPDTWFHRGTTLVTSLVLGIHRAAYKGQQKHHAFWVFRLPSLRAKSYILHNGEIHVDCMRRDVHVYIYIYITKLSKRT